MYCAEAHSVKSVVTAGMVTLGVSIYEKLLQNVNIVTVLENLESIYGLNCCLNSAAKLKTIIEKTDTEDERLWVLQCLEDGLLQKPPLLHNDSIGLADLRGSASKLSLINLFKFKKSAYQYVLDLAAPRANFDLDQLTLMKQKTQDHASYRKWCAPLVEDHGAAVDTTWQSSSQLLLKLVQELLYESAWHASIAALLKTKKGRCHPKELLDQEGFLKRWQAAVDSVKTEQAEEAGKTAAASEPEERGEEAGAEDAKMSLSKMVSSSPWASTAAKMSGAGATSLAELIEKSPLGGSTVQGTAGKTAVYIVYDAGSYILSLVRVFCQATYNGPCFLALGRSGLAAVGGELRPAGRSTPVSTRTRTMRRRCWRVP